MGSAFGCISRTDLENASATEVGLYVGKIGPDYKKYQMLIVNNAFNGVYIIFKYTTKVDELFSLLCITDLAHIDLLKYKLFSIYENQISIPRRYVDHDLY
jgi:hypothetical protein